MKIKRFALALFLTSVLMFSNCEVVSAADYVRPQIPAGYTILNEQYDAYGNVGVTVDADGDGTCDAGVVLMRKPGNKGKMILFPTIDLSCEDMVKGQEFIRERLKATGTEAKIYDNDIRRLVPLKNSRI